MGAAWSGVGLFICCLLLLLLLPLLSGNRPPPTMRKAWAGRTSARRFNKTQSPPLDCLLPAKIDIFRQYSRLIARPSAIYGYHNCHSLLLHRPPCMYVCMSLRHAHISSPHSQSPASSPFHHYY